MGKIGQKFLQHFISLFNEVKTTSRRLMVSSSGPLSQIGQSVVAVPSCLAKRFKGGFNQIKKRLNKKIKAVKQRVRKGLKNLNREIKRVKKRVISRPKKILKKIRKIDKKLKKWLKFKRKRLRKLFQNQSKSYAKTVRQTAKSVAELPHWFKKQFAPLFSIGKKLSFSRLIEPFIQKLRTVARPKDRQLDLFGTASWRSFLKKWLSVFKIKSKSTKPAKPKTTSQSKTVSKSKSKPKFKANKWLKDIKDRLLDLKSNLKNSIAAAVNNNCKRIKSIRKSLGKRAQFATARIKNRLSRIKRFIRNFLSSLLAGESKPIIISLLTTVMIIGSAWFVYDLIFKDLPSALDLTQKEQIVTTRILDRNGKLLFRFYKDENRTLVPLSQIPQHMINATIAIEDKNFYRHHGFSLRGIIRAFFKNLQTDSVQGGSTITQQLVKNRLLNNQKTLRRKVRELLLAILVESTFSKDEILEMYLNEVPYGGATYGVEEAAWRYFNKPARELTLGESAMLAGLPAAPSVYTPFGPNPERGKRRQAEVLRRMVEDNFITIEEAYLAEQEQLQLRKDLINIKAPHFVMYVKSLLAERYGEEVVNQGGLEVRTTLDLNLQQHAQQVVTEEVNRLENLNVNNGAALVTNPQTGEILAMVGSKDYFDFENDGQVNVVLRPRQPGSSIKPLTYALAFENGKNPWDVIDDSPITYNIPGSQPYSPRNYDNRFHGRVTLRQALANSYNVPAVKTLASLGVDSLIDKGQEMGISTWTDRQRFGLSLTLGAGEVLMSDMAQVYGAFANGGYKLKLDPFLEIRNYQGELLYRNECFNQPDQCQQQSVLDPLAAYRITTVLSDNQARAAAFGRFSVLEIPNQEVAVKTGTTNDLRDNWTIGYTTNRLVGVWVGNNDNTSMSRVASGITGASPIWNEIMRYTLSEDHPHQFSWPEGFVELKICAYGGTLPCQGCPVITQEVFREDNRPTRACNPQQFVKREKEEEKQEPSEGQIL